MTEIRAIQADPTIFIVSFEVTRSYPEKLVKSPNPDREKLKTDNSLLQSSDFQVEVTVKRSSIN